MRELSVAEQRYQAVLAVIGDGLSVSLVAEKVGVSRQTLHAWLARYESEGLEGLRDRSHRPVRCPHQMSAELVAQAAVTARRSGSACWHVCILRAVRTFGNGDEVAGVVAVQGAAVHHVGRDRLLRLARSKLVANQVTGGDSGLGRLVEDAVGVQRCDETAIGSVGVSGRGRSQRAKLPDHQYKSGSQQR
jgi:transposase